MTVYQNLGGPNQGLGGLKDRLIRWTEDTFSIYFLTMISSPKFET